MNKSSLELFFILVILSLTLNACTAAPTPTPVPTATATATPTQTATPLPTNTATTAPTATSTSTRTNTPKPTASNTPRIPTATPTKANTPGPSPTMSAAQLCANLVSSRPNEIYILYLRPEPELAWDKEPRQFHVGLCNTIPPSSPPQGKYKITLTFPTANNLFTQSAPTQGELKPGMNDVSVGPWIPGLENHLANCAVKSRAETRVLYNDSPDPTLFRALLWTDGSDKSILNVQCGGNYP